MAARWPLAALPTRRSGPPVPAPASAPADGAADGAAAPRPPRLREPARLRPRPTGPHPARRRPTRRRTTPTGRRVRRSWPYRRSRHPPSRASSRCRPSRAMGRSRPAGRPARASSARPRAASRRRRATSRWRRARPASRRSEAIRVGRRQPEVARSARGREGTVRRHDREQVVVELRTRRAVGEPCVDHAALGRARGSRRRRRRCVRGRGRRGVEGFRHLGAQTGAARRAVPAPAARAAPHRPESGGSRVVGRVSPSRSASASDRRSTTRAAQFGTLRPAWRSPELRPDPARRRRRRRRPRGRGTRAGQPRNSSIRSSRRPRSASRPRWMRDFTVPSETPVMSAISA